MAAQPVMTMYLAFVGEIPADEATAEVGEIPADEATAEDAPLPRSMGGSKRAQTKGFPQESESKSKKKQTYLRGVDSEQLAALYASMTWSLQTQKKKKLPFALVQQPEPCEIVQAVELGSKHPGIDICKHYTWNLKLDPSFINEDLTLVSSVPREVPKDLQTVYDAVRCSEDPKCDFVLLTEKQLRLLTTQNLLGQAFIAQKNNRSDAKNQWYMELEDEYWLCPKANVPDFMATCVAFAKPTFQIKQTIKSAKITQEPDKTSPETTAPQKQEVSNATYLLGVELTHTAAAGTAPSSTWKCCRNPGDLQAMPLLEKDDKKLTQLFFLCFQIFASAGQTLSFTNECAICMDKHSEFEAAGCCHAFCPTCVETIQDASGDVKCPICRATHSRDDMVTVQLPQKRGRQGGSAEDPIVRRPTGSAKDPIVL